MASNVRLKNWDAVGKLFEFTLPELLIDEVDKAMDEATLTYSEAIKEIIDEQPGDWTPKSEGWAERTTQDLYIGETGEFYEEVTSPDKNTRGVRAKRGDKRLFVGARYDIKHGDLTVEQLANILQAIPDGSRDLFGRAYERVSDKIDLIFERVGTKLK